MPVATTVNVAPAPTVVICGCGWVVIAGAVAGATAVAMPALSHVARPPTRKNPMPVTVLPSSPTALAGTLRRTHCPVDGNTPT